MGWHAGHEDGQLTTLTPSATSNRHPKGLMWLLLYSDMLLLACDTLSEVLQVKKKLVTCSRGKTRLNQVSVVVTKGLWT